jgi:hypothetical protein
MGFHLGGGEQRLDGYTNVDLQTTAATDLNELDGRFLQAAVLARNAHPT